MTEDGPPPSIEAIWARYDADEARLSAPLSERMLDLAELRPGMQVLDIASGRGEPALRAARRVAPKGRVVGTDCAESMLRMAQARAQREGVRNLELRRLAAESLATLPQASFDAALARWGLMYLEDPVAALKGARHALRPGGLLVVAVWAEPERVPYFSLPREVLARHAPVPPIEIGVQGTFRYAAADALARDLVESGFDLLAQEEVEVDVMEARTPAELVAWTRAFGMGRLLNTLPQTVQRAWAADLVAMAPSLRKGGVMRLGGVTRIVVARRAA
ncbi:class I SAM-dependent methyltransferase [Niveibacterium umoris]|uniref:Ubiquinone/menaquinone biosynthesis C-methylase UbiE n=1 Tax=Niveibacterium umoris TaxID=1193620 RepID=A0A840BNT7_9RHOO|nr:class I SAM-dependent methyltransferase [Niveibacterium umoris]MBB4014254.1 ubiquinone/menaquinone biosynthesis C-methylase UbiE [Niveibacterium umoris]